MTDCMFRVTGDLSDHASRRKLLAVQRQELERLARSVQVYEDLRGRAVGRLMRLADEYGWTYHDGELVPRAEIFDHDHNAIWRVKP